MTWLTAISAVVSVRADAPRPSATATLTSATNARSAVVTPLVGVMASLTDVRAVLSRAQTTRHELIWGSYSGNIAWDQPSWDESLARRGYDSRPLENYPHLPTEPTGDHWIPEYADAVDGYVAALDVAIDALKPYEAKPWKARRPW